MNPIDTYISEATPEHQEALTKLRIHIYHMGVGADPDILKWWEDAYKKENIGKLDMGKSCIRFKNLEKIPYTLIGELCKKITVREWIDSYESHLHNQKS